MKSLIFIGMSVLLLCGCQDSGDARQSIHIKSPDGSIVATVSTDDFGRLFYAVQRNGNPVIFESNLGFNFSNADSFSVGLNVAEKSRNSVDYTWEQPWGERRFVRDHHNELLLEVSDKYRQLKLRFRAFDDGVAFRYEFDDLFHEGELLISNELTQFKVADIQSSAFWIPSFGLHRYEYQYRVSSLRDMDVAQTPVTFASEDGSYVTIHEAALVDYSSMVLRPAPNNVLNAELVPGYDGIKVRRTGGFVTPWRTIQIARDAPTLLTSDMILNLNEPNKLGDVSWIKPGVYMGIWWALHIKDIDNLDESYRTWGTGPKLGATTAEAMRYIDFISEHGLDGFLAEGWNTGWDGDWIQNGKLFSFTKSQPFYDLEKVAAYAQDKNVALIMHNENSGEVDHYARQMDEAYELYENLGVHYIKTGYVAHANGYPRFLPEANQHNAEDQQIVYEWNYGQWMVNQMQESIDKAAKHRLAINMHEPIKATGLRRTFPNFMTREGVRGQEYNAWAKSNHPDHTTILPFTRMMAGPLDFTPGIFNVWPHGEDHENRVKTTVAKQLALMVVLYSPLQMAADLPKNYAARPDLFQFIKDVPADWEESIVLGAEIGEYVVYARQERGTKDWFVGGITDEEPRRFLVDFSFLSDGEYVAAIYKDGEDADWDKSPFSTETEKMTLTAKSKLDVDMAPGGGFAISLIRQ